jgi:hypothetical protein
MVDDDQPLLLGRKSVTVIELVLYTNTFLLVLLVVLAITLSVRINQTLAKVDAIAAHLPFS